MSQVTRVQASGFAVVACVVSACASPDPLREIGRRNADDGMPRVEVEVSICELPSAHALVGRWIDIDNEPALVTEFLGAVDESGSRGQFATRTQSDFRSWLGQSLLPRASKADLLAGGPVSTPVGLCPIACGLERAERAVAVWQGQDFCILLSLGAPYLLPIQDHALAWVPRDLSQSSWDQRVAVQPKLVASILETWGSWRLARRARTEDESDLCRIHFIGESDRATVFDDEWACAPNALTDPEFEKCLWYFICPMFRRDGERLSVTASGGGDAPNTWSMAFENRDSFRQAARDIIHLSLADRVAKGAALEIRARMSAP